MEEVSTLLARMLTKAREETPLEESVSITLTTSQCYRICARYGITPFYLYKAIQSYCEANDINLQPYEG